MQGTPAQRPDIIDTHCHLDVAAFDADRAAVLARARAAGVGRIVVPAIEAAGWPGLLALCRAEPGLYPALGLHPVFLERHRARDLQALRARLARDRPLAVGEIGLDFYLRELDRGRQQQLFEAQLELAREAGLPVLLHVRRAHYAVLPALARSRPPGGIAHAFNGSMEEAARYIDLGFVLGFGGMLTYTRSRRLRALASALPLEAIVLETDAPDMSPQAHQGTRNSPDYLPLVLRTLAELRGLSEQAVAAATSANARRVLGL